MSSCQSCFWSLWVSHNGQQPWGHINTLRWILPAHLNPNAYSFSRQTFICSSSYWLFPFFSNHAGYVRCGSVGVSLANEMYEKKKSIKCFGLFCLSSCQWVELHICWWAYNFSTFAFVAKTRVASILHISSCAMQSKLSWALSFLISSQSELSMLTGSFTRGWFTPKLSFSHFHTPWATVTLLWSPRPSAGFRVSGHKCSS